MFKIPTVRKLNIAVVKTPVPQSVVTPWNAPVPGFAGTVGDVSQLASVSKTAIAILHPTV